MNKDLAEFFAAFIPNKMERNRWRGLLRYGPINALRLRFEVKKHHEEPKHFLSVCSIVKNEGAYFKEWLDWHIRMGVDHFYIYDNESDDNTLQVLQPYIDKGIITYKLWESRGIRVRRRQIAVYDDCINRYRYDTHWLAFIDLDEFIVPMKDATIPLFLKRFEQFSAVEINWLCYGSGGQKKKSDAPVMERFKRHSQWNHPLNRSVKSIVQPKRCYDMIGAHEASRIYGKAADSHGQPITKHCGDREPQHDVIRINHYAVKSYEEFLIKQAMGRANGKAKRMTDQYFTNFDLNDIEEK